MSTGQTDEPAALNRDQAKLATDRAKSEQAQAGRGVHADVSAAAQPRPGFFRRIVSTSAALGVAGLFVGAMIGGITVLKTRADTATDVQANPVIRVNTQAFRIQENYAIGQSFVGRIEPTRQTQLAFERAGTVLEVIVEEGVAVKAGQTIARLGTAGLKTRQQELQAQRAETQARLSLAKATAGRQRALNRRGWAAQQSFDEARFQVAQLEAVLKRNDASLASVDVDLEKSVLKAPFAGRISTRDIDEGAIVQTGQVVAGLMESGRARLRVGINRAASQKLRVGRSYQFEVANRLVNAKLVTLRPDLDRGSRTVTALFETDRTPDAPFGSIVALKIDRTVDEPGAWVPIASLNEGAKGLWTVLTVVENDGAEVVRREAVEILHVADGRAFIRSSIPDGTRFIIDGTNRVTPGQRVALLETPGT